MAGKYLFIEIETNTQQNPAKKCSQLKDPLKVWQQTKTEFASQKTLIGYCCFDECNKDGIVALEK